MSIKNVVEQPGPVGAGLAPLPVPLTDHKKRCKNFIRPIIFKNTVDHKFPFN
jgi:hypothetical protein